MIRQNLLSLLSSYQPEDGGEKHMYNDTIGFVESQPACFERSLLSGHVTGSGWVVSPDRAKVLLMHHRKLDRWFQPGGHCDGDPDVAAVAMKEVTEETGLKNVSQRSSSIFDVDVHEIPERGSVPAHLHYDIRFLFEADPTERLLINSESKDLQWVELGEVEKLNNSESIMRMVRKTSRFTASQI